MKKRLTVVTTCYNQEKYIDLCIKGILNQKTNFDFELLISDDCSTDNTRQIIERYVEQYPNRIKTIFRQKNIGPMNNFIETLNLVDTEYVALCDGDDFWIDNNKLQKQVDYLDSNKKCNICFHKVEVFWDDMSYITSLHPVNFEEYINFNELLRENFITANSVVYRWKYRKKNSLINDFPKDIVPGDYYLNLIHAHNSKIGYIDDIMSKYRRNPSGMWWMNSQPHLAHDFFDKYGLKQINFL